MNELSNNNIIPPFLKWAGGKRWLVRNHSRYFPDAFNRYIEPFLGSGAVFFHLMPERALLGDINQDLVDAFLGVKKNQDRVVGLLREHHRNHCAQYYYRMRKSRPRSVEGRAARLIYLNRTCWNGLYRVNLQGDFNVPIGSKKSIVRAEDDFDAVSRRLNNARIECVDFEVLVNKAEKGDFLFVDPPYTVSHNQNAFIKYNEKLFSWEDQERLVEALSRAKKRGVMILGTNAYHRSVRDLYKNAGFISHKVERKSIISCTNKARRDYSELVITANLK